MTAPYVERIDDARGAPIAYIVRAGKSPDATTFVTPPEASLQLGFVVYPAGEEIPRHDHKPLQRELVGTSEMLLVREGSCAVDLYDRDRVHTAERTLNRGDVILLLGGGHGFRLLEDTVLLEVKQGPYTGIDEKERF